MLAELKDPADPDLLADFSDRELGLGLDSFRFLSWLLDPSPSSLAEEAAADVKKPDSLLEEELDLVFSGELELSQPLADPTRGCSG